jgi:hypothetical protein
MLGNTELFTYAGYIVLRIETNLCGNGTEHSLCIHIWRGVSLLPEWQFFKKDSVLCSNSFISKLRGSFQKFCTLYIFSLKMNLFYKIHLQAFNVIPIVLYHSGPTFGQVLYSCLDVFVVDASDYPGNLIRHLLSTSEAFPTEWFLGKCQSLVGRQKLYIQWLADTYVGHFRSSAHCMFSL